MIGKNVLKSCLTTCLLSLTASLAWAGGSLLPGTLTLNGGISAPAGFFNVSNVTTCQSATISGCANVNSLNLNFCVTSPANPLGTIVLHNGNAGTAPFNEPNASNGAAAAYYNANYRVVQLAWASDWPITGITSPAVTYDIKSAACRPATFFQYIHDAYTTAGAPMCLQGGSAGAGAIAYYLTHYNGYKYTNKAVLLTGPQFADVQQGCEVPNDPAATLCPSGTPYCASGIISPWTEMPQYSTAELGTWAGSACNAGTLGTSPLQDTAWKTMSLIDGVPADSTWTLPHTAISGYLCNYVPWGSGVNPSEAQGWMFFHQLAINSTSVTLHQVNDCATAWNPVACAVTSLGTNASAEEVWNGQTLDGTCQGPQLQYPKVPSYVGTAIVTDMISGNSPCNHIN